MAKIIYVEHGGDEHEVEVPLGWSLMQAAVRAGIDGIEGECGGSCACATCHVYVDEDRLDLLPPPADNELAMLENTASQRRANSRLACQIKMSEALDGMVVHMPEFQSE